MSAQEMFEDWEEATGKKLDLKFFVSDHDQAVGVVCGQEFIAQMCFQGGDTMRYVKEKVRRHIDSVINSHKAKVKMRPKLRKAKWARYSRRV